MMKKIILVLGVMLLFTSGLYAQGRPFMRMGRRIQRGVTATTTAVASTAAAAVSTTTAAVANTAAAMLHPQKQMPQMQLLQASMFEKAVVEEVNLARARAHLKPLELDETQCASARRHSRYMASYGLRHASGYMECIAMYPTRSKQEADIALILPDPSETDDAAAGIAMNTPASADKPETPNLAEEAQESEAQESESQEPESAEADTETEAGTEASTEADTEAEETVKDEIDPMVRREARCVVNLWLNSPPHRAIIMSGASKIAIGRYGAWHTLRVWR